MEGQGLDVFQSNVARECKRVRDDTVSRVILINVIRLVSGLDASKTLLFNTSPPCVPQNGWRLQVELKLPLHSQGHGLTYAGDSSWNHFAEDRVRASHNTLLNHCRGY